MLRSPDLDPALDPDPSRPVEADPDTSTIQATVTDGDAGP